jgi:hypothetical protein
LRTGSRIGRTTWAFQIILSTAFAASAGTAPADPLEQDSLARKARSALHRAASFYQKRVARHGGHVWRSSEDLRLREGEEAVGPDTIWVQPPGTPAVGLAYLRAFRATGDRIHLDAARETALALVRGQLRSGGWTYRIDFGDRERRTVAYREGPVLPGQDDRSVLDDDTTTSALLCLMSADQALGFRQRRIHEAALYGLRALLLAQQVSGCYPQRFDGPAPGADATPARASLPVEWPRIHPRDPQYWRLCTLNDDLAPAVLRVLLEAERVHGGGAYRGAALRLGEFLVRAQLPEPQPAWAQQYDALLQPAWARRFEPPAIAGRESQGVIESLLLLFRHTGDARFLEPVPRALAYLEASRLPDGRLPRFRELGSDRPLYFTREYALTASDADLPTHYAFKVESRLPALGCEYRRLSSGTPETCAGPQLAGEALRREVRRLVDALDAHGRWVEEGRLRDGTPRRILDSRTFIRNVELLCRYLELAGPGARPSTGPR